MKRLILISKKKDCIAERNMTLVEMIVVIGIMAAVASVAIVNIDSLQEESRYTETIRRGNLFIEQISNHNDGRTSKFIADMGRIPYVINTLQGLQLAELFYSGEDIKQFDPTMLFSYYTFTNSTTDWGGVTGAGTFSFSSSVTTLYLACGWRGPYIIINSKKFYDGWGNEWEFKISDSNLWNGSMSWTKSPDSNKAIFGIRTLGKNDLRDSGNTKWYDKDLEFNIEENRCTADLEVQIMYVDSSSTPAVPVPISSAFMNYIRVAIFAPYITPDGNSADNVKRILVYNNNGSHYISIIPAEDAGYPHQEDDISPIWIDFHSVTIHNLSPGPRKLYVYGFKNSTGSTNKYGSRLLSVYLTPGTNNITVYLTEAL